MTTPAPPRISLLLPCRDAEPFLPGCIASLEAQTERDFEVLALDDGSADGTPSLLAAWAERDARVRVLPRRAGGLVDALRALAGSARAARIARMDADDVAYPTRLARQLELLAKRPDVAACGTGVRYVPRERVGPGYRRYERWLNGLTEPDEIERDLFVECPIAHPTLMIRRRVFEAVGGYRELGGPEDYDLILRVAAAGHALANVPEVLHDWRLGGHRLSGRSARYSADAFRALKVLHLTPRIPDDRPVVVWGAGKVGKAFTRAWQRAGRAVAALVDIDPRKIGQTIHRARVLAPPELAGFPGPRPYTLIAVGSPGARDEIREALDGLGFRELEDYRAVA